MEENETLRWLQQGLGAIILVLVLLDIFLTILYARIGASVFSNKIARLVWRLFRLISKPFGRRAGEVLTFCGPIILITLLGFWFLGLTFSVALIIHPALGSAIKTSNGHTSTDFITALYAAGNSISIVGAGDHSPQTKPYRIFYIFTSMVGMSVTSLTLIYLMQVYNGLQRRNAQGLRSYLLSDETGDAAELLCGLGPEGKFDNGLDSLAETATGLTQSKEAYHFYPVLFFFRFREPYYSVSKSLLMAFDTASLIKSALDDQEYNTIKESAVVAALWRGARLEVTSLEDTFLPGGVPDDKKEPDTQTYDRWARRFTAALERFKEAGIKTIADEQEEIKRYVELRSRWEHHITALAPVLAYRMEEIDPAGFNPESAKDRQEFRRRLYAFD
ncbi:potassium channel family protein [Pontibacter chitinilyticus]|uniref:potassium channel family protein n=1 Tax=Pontibacter chitinilyticus TaxID=2674989 RepID=UPI00321B8778